MSMHTVLRKLRPALPVAVALALSGCFGGSVAQQIASSMAVHAADRVTASMVESQELGTGTGQQQMVLADRAPDPYWTDFVTAGFAPATPQAQPQPLPEQAVQPAADAEMMATPLMRVEIWNLLVGEEKRAFLETARLRDAASVPPPEEWPQWEIAAGGRLDDAGKMVTFLIPPGLGRVASGAHAVVEATAGGLYYARHVLN
jgi:hypothetical protein